MFPVLQAVPNFSEGRDARRLRELIDVIGDAGVEVLDWSSDPDHNRCVVTYIGGPASVEAASLVAARFAREHFDLRVHRGVHPRVGALDVLPFVPLQGLTLLDAAASAHRVGRALADQLGIPIYFYGEASTRPLRRLSELRRGGFEALASGFPEGREPDLSAGLTAAHPSAGVTCVGARRMLLAWNLYLEGVDLEVARELACELRAVPPRAVDRVTSGRVPPSTGISRGAGGFAALRVLAFRLESQDRLQLSMNLEDMDRTSPFDVYRYVERRLGQLGGRITETEVIGMIPDALVLPAAADRLRVVDCPPSRLLSPRLVRHVAERACARAEARLQAVGDKDEAAPGRVRDGVIHPSGSMTRLPSLGQER